MNDTVITRAGLEKLQTELDELRTTGRLAIAERIREAATSESNAGDSVEFQDAREELALLERRIAVLEQRLGTATVAEPEAGNGIADVGERVTVRNLDTGEIHEYRLVGVLEAAPSDGRISVASPLGQALLGARAGATAVVDAPRGRMRFEIVSIAEERGRTARRSTRRATAAVPDPQPAG